MNIFPKTLGVFSQYFWTRELVASNAIVFWADLNGSIDEDKLRSSLGAVQFKYPLLRARVEKKPGQMPRFVVHQAAIDLRVVRPNEEQRVAQVIETEMREGSDHSLFRVVLLRSGEKKATLIFVANHAITDARGLSFILRDLLHVMNDMPIGPPVETVLTHEDLFNEPMLRDYVQTLPSTETLNPSADASKLKSQRTVFAATAVLSPSELGVALERARAERTTIQGALMAALALAAQELHPLWGDDPSVQMLVPVDLRRFHFGEGSTDLLAYPVLVPFRQDGSMSFWELARAYKELLSSLITFEAGQAFVRQSQQLLSVEWEPQAFLDTTNEGFPHDLFMSNLGTVAIPARYGRLELERIGFSTISGPAMTQSVCAATFQGSMYLSQLSYEPFEGLLQRMSRQLTVACS